MRERLQNHIHAINCNAFFLLRVINTPPIFSHEILVNDQNHQATHLDNTKVVSVLRQFVREWAAEGSVEKEKSNDLILNALQTLFPEPETRSNLTILVPGCGLGRLVYEIAHLGFSCEGILTHLTPRK
jgi:carnosine N-methyltransferase